MVQPFSYKLTGLWLTSGKFSSWNTFNCTHLITLYYTDTAGRHMPVNFRIYDKSEGKTKNDYFLEMLEEVLAWGLQPAFVTGDSWYSCIKNLKTIKNHQTGFMFAVENNRTVSLEKGQWQQVQTLEIPDDGLDVWLKDFGKVRLFRTTLKDQCRHYVVYLPEDVPFQRNDFTQIHDKHWQIEQHHRAIKQVCHIEQYKKDIKEKEGRRLTSQKAAIEWIAKHGAEFPNPRHDDAVND